MPYCRYCNKDVNYYDDFDHYNCKECGKIIDYYRSNRRIGVILIGLLVLIILMVLILVNGIDVTTLELIGLCFMGCLVIIALANFYTNLVIKKEYLSTITGKGEKFDKQSLEVKE